MREITLPPGTHMAGCMCPLCSEQPQFKVSSAPPLALYTIQAELAELLELRETAVAEGELPEALAAIDEQIKAYMAREVRKVDNICHAIHSYEAAAEAAQKEADRMAERAKALRSRVERIKEQAKAAMLAHGVRVIETPANKLRIQGNGGLQPLDIPAWPKDSSGDFKIVALVEGEPSGLPDIPLRWYAAPDTFAIREALKRGPVDGARLLVRGSHLRCE